MRTREVKMNSNREDFEQPRFPERSEAEQDTPPLEAEAVPRPSNPFSSFEREAEQPVVVASAPPDLPFTRTTSELGPEWVRQDVLSLYVPYSFDQLFVRPLTLPLLSKLSLATRQRDFTLLVDVMAECVSEDVRELTPSDFNFLMYWIRDNSFTRTPITITWMSRYNNINKLSFRRSDLEFTELALTREQYAEYQAWGLCFPTVRDMELLKSNQAKPEEQWMVEYAQYVAYTPANGDYRDYAEQKLARLERIVTERGLEDTILKINEFSERIVHGTSDTVRARDAHFDPEKAATYFENVAEAAFETAKLVEQGDEPASVLQVFRMANAYLGEAQEIRVALEQGVPVEAKEEVVAIRMEATDFFPGLR